MKTYRRLLAFARPYGPFMIPFVIFSILGIVFDLANFSLIVPLLDTLFKSGTMAKEIAPESLPPFSFSIDFVKQTFYYYLVNFVNNYGQHTALLFICLVTVGSSFFKNLFRYLSIRVLENFKARTIKQVRMTIYEKVTSLHVGYFTNQRKGDLMARASTDVNEVEHSITNSVAVFLKDPLYVVVYFAVLFYLSFQLTLFTLAIIPVSAAIITFINKRLKSESKKTQHIQGSLLGILDETITGLRVIKAFNAIGFMRKKYADENDHYRKAYTALAYRRELAAPTSEFTGGLIVAVILMYGGSLVFDDSLGLSASEFIAYLVFFTQILNPMKTISKAVSNIQRGIVAGDRLLTIIDTPTDIQNVENPLPVTAFTDRISFRNVAFSYEEKTILSQINFDLIKGKTVALVGPSGGGKSTLADLLPRFYDVKQGEVLLDGTDIRQYELGQLRQLMGVVTQESLLFNDTIFNNIAFGKEGADLNEVIKAAKIANAHDFIMQTENGYDTTIGDRGMKLSGGQRQRLSIARAIFKNPPILILDEATSALDTESEKLVQDALYKLMENRTSLVIAHRLSTIQHADTILVIDQGKIVEQGSHESLLQNENGLYKKLQEMQAI